MKSATLATVRQSVQLMVLVMPLVLLLPPPLTSLTGCSCRCCSSGHHDSQAGQSSETNQPEGLDRGKGANGEHEEGIGSFEEPVARCSVDSANLRSSKPIVLHDEFCPVTDVDQLRDAADHTVQRIDLDDAAWPPVTVAEIGREDHAELHSGEDPREGVRFEQQANCGIRKELIRRGTGESDVGPDDQWPFFATIMSNKYGSEVCGAAIISAQLLVSSYSCVSRLSYMPDYQVVLGSWGRGEETFRGQVFWPHEDCNVAFENRMSFNGANISLNDYVVIQLDDRISWNEAAAPVCLANSIEMFAKGENGKCFVIGHSRNNQTGVLTVRYWPVEYLKCWATEEKQRFCFKRIWTKTHQCPEDSGGPVLCQVEDKWQLIGIVSTIFPNCRKDVPRPPGVFDVATDFTNITVLERCIRESNFKI